MMRIVLLFMSVLTLHAADQPTICYLALLPDEVLDKIALLIDWDDRETDEAFVKRAEQYGRVSLEHMELVRTHHSYNDNCLVDVLRELAAYSIDRTKIIVFEHAWKHQVWDPIKAVDEAFVIDLATNTKRTHKKLTGIIKDNHRYAWDTGISKSTHYIAVSRTGSHLAELQHWQEAPFDLGNAKSVLIITAIKTGERKEYVLPSFYFCQDFLSISFNKQTTQVIAVGDALLKKPFVQRIVSDEEHVAKSVMTFDLFLKTQMICKSLRGKEKL